MPLPSNLQQAIKKDAPKVRRSQEAAPWSLDEGRKTVIKQIDDYLSFMETGEWTRTNPKTGELSKKFYLVNENSGVYGVNIKYMTESLVDSTMDWTTEEEAVEWLKMFRTAVEERHMDEEIVSIKAWCGFRNSNYTKELKAENVAKKEKEDGVPNPRTAAEINAERRADYYKNEDHWKEFKKNYKDIQFSM